jgi:transcriptional regulator with XRE-family HTH domain
MQDLAEKANVHYNTVWRAENGKTEPGPAVAKIVAALEARRRVRWATRREIEEANMSALLLFLFLICLPTIVRAGAFAVNAAIWVVVVPATWLGMGVMFMFLAAHAIR